MGEIGETPRVHAGVRGGTPEELSQEARGRWVLAAALSLLGSVVALLTIGRKRREKPDGIEEMRDVTRPSV